MSSINDLYLRRLRYAQTHKSSILKTAEINNSPINNIVNYNYLYINANLSSDGKSSITRENYGEMNGFKIVSSCG
jgi:hypothetical protein